MTWRREKALAANRLLNLVRLIGFSGWLCYGMGRWKYGGVAGYANDLALGSGCNGVDSGGGRLRGY